MRRARRTAPHGDASGVGTDTFTGRAAASAARTFDDTLLGSNNLTGRRAFFRAAAATTSSTAAAASTARSIASALDDNVTGGITVDLAAGTVTGDASVGTDTLRSIEVVRGTNFADTYDATGFTASARQRQCRQRTAPSTSSKGWAATTPSPATATRGSPTINATGGRDGRSCWPGTGALAIGLGRHRHLHRRQRDRQGSQFADTLCGSNNAAGHRRAVRWPCRQRHFRRPRRLRPGGLQQRRGGDRRHHRRHGGRHGDRRRLRSAPTRCGRSRRSAAPTSPIPMCATGFSGASAECRQHRHVQRVRGPGRQRHHHRQRQHPDRLLQRHRRA